MTRPPRSQHEAFAPSDWAGLATVAAIWGSSFLLIEIGLDHFAPPLVAMLRLAFCVMVLAMFPSARRSVPRSEWPAIAALGLFSMALPFLLFPIAQRSIDSSLAGMLNATAPLFVAVIAAIIHRRLPGARQQLGLVAGFAGVVLISWPAIVGAHASVRGVVLVLLATLSYGIAGNLAAPLQVRNGALPVVFRASVVALALLVPFGLGGLPTSSFAWSSLIAVGALGVFGTAIALVAFTTLLGRVGATRGSVTIYFLPPIAMALGALVRDERIAALSIIGTGLVLVGAWLASRAERTPASMPTIEPTTLRRPADAA
ncbi:MAG TPA: DMT family transporter [Gemmatimonadaceae bacterium]|nr:DMT family transporter [Gemmatimonadaceae bacterium]